MITAILSGTSTGTISVCVKECGNLQLFIETQVFSIAFLDMFKVIIIEFLHQTHNFICNWYR